MDAFDYTQIAYCSSRLVGIEVELDSGSTPFRAPTELPEWEATRDRSLSNGMEYVLTPALPYNRVLPAIKNFDDRVTAARTNITSRGSLHVHVQAHDMSPTQAHNLCRLYSRFQADIDLLVADSRKSNRNHTFCKPLPVALTVMQWGNMFNWQSKVETRQAAKRGNRYWTVNCQTMSIVDPALRSVEFRQQSATRKAANIYGWVSLCVVLVELSRTSDVNGIPPRMTLAELLQEYPAASGVAEWVQWRSQYLSQTPTDALIQQAVGVLRSYHGIHHVSRHLNVPLPVAKAVCEAGRARGLLVAEGLRYRASAPLPRQNSLTQLQEENLRLRRLLMERREPVASS